MEGLEVHQIVRWPQVVQHHLMASVVQVGAVAVEQEQQVLRVDRAVAVGGYQDQAGQVRKVALVGTLQAQQAGVGGARGRWGGVWGRVGDGGGDVGEKVVGGWC